MSTASATAAALAAIEGAIREAQSFVSQDMPWQAQVRLDSVIEALVAARGAAMVAAFDEAARMERRVRRAAKKEATR